MRNVRTLKTLILLLFCLGMTAMQAQIGEPFEDPFDEPPGPPVKKSYEERLRDFDKNLEDARDYFSQQDNRGPQANSHKKIEEGLEGFLETEFIKKYRELKLEMESLAASFKAYEQMLDPEDIVKVRKAYVRITQKFNQLLVDIKKDFLDPQTLRLIRSAPKWYAANLESRLRALKDDYTHEYERVIADIMATDEYGAAPLFAIFGIIKFTVDFTNYLARVRYDKRQVKEEYLNEHFIQAFRFRTWEEIETISGNIYGDDFNRYQNYDQNYSPFAQDPFDDTDPSEEEGEAERLKLKKVKSKGGG